MGVISYQQWIEVTYQWVQAIFTLAKQQFEYYNITKMDQNFPILWVVDYKIATYKVHDADVCTFRQQPQITPEHDRQSQCEQDRINRLQMTSSTRCNHRWAAQDNQDRPLPAVYHSQILCQLMSHKQALFYNLLHGNPLHTSHINHYQLSDILACQKMWLRMWACSSSYSSC